MVREHRPVGLEGIDAKLIDYMRTKGLHPDDVDLLPEGDGFLLVEFGADTKSEADDQADALHRRDRRDSTTRRRSRSSRTAGRSRSSGRSASRASAPPPRCRACPAPTPAGRTPRCHPTRSATTSGTSATCSHEFDYDASLYGHFGQGCIHCRIDFALDTAHGVAQWRAFLDRAADLVVSYGGSLSGEHGDGQARAALLAKMYGEELVGAFAEFKDIWDPDGRMNPGKVVRPNRPDDDLRAGPDVDAAPGPRPTSRSPTTTSTSPTPPAAASASG